MNRNLVLLIIPPVLALALLAFFNNPEQKDVATPKAAMPEKTETKAEIAIPKKAIMPNKAVQAVPTEQDGRSQEAVEEPLSGIDQIRAIKNKTALHDAVLKDHEDFSRYPSQNVRFELPERDPVFMMYETQERTTESEDKTASLTAWTDKKYLLQGETVEIYARVDDSGNTGIPNTLVTAVFHNETRQLGTFDLNDPDGDGTYSLELSAEQTKDWPIGIYKALIASNHKKLSESVSFVLSPPAINITGEYREKITPQGDLLFEIEVETKEASRYYIRASLYSESNIPIGSAQFSDNLSRGTHWIPLSYFGLMIRDSNEPGPYFIRTVELAKSGIPMLRMPPAEASMYTQSYALDEFNAQSYQEQQTLK